MPISAESHPLSPEQAATFDQVLGRGVGKDFLRLIGQQLGAILAMPRECGPTR